MACWKEHQSAECLGESNLTVEALCRRMLILDDKKEVWEVHQEDGVEFDPEGSLIKCFPYCFFDSKSAVYAYEPLKTFEEVEAEYIHRLTAIFQELAQGYAAQTLSPMSGVQAVPSGPASKDVRVVLRLHPALAPYKAAVLPLSKKLADKGREIQQELSKYFMVDYDDAGSIGKRYRREDEIGTPLCITVDFETVGDENTPADHCVTVRDRDTMEQVRIPISELRGYIEKKLEF